MGVGYSVLLIPADLLVCMGLCNLDCLRYWKCEMFYANHIDPEHFKFHISFDQISHSIYAWVLNFFFFFCIIQIVKGE